MNTAVTFILKADGKDISRDVRLLSVTTRYELHAIPEIFIQLADGDPATGEFELSEKKELAPGKTVELSASFMGSKGKEATLFSGLVTGQRITVNRGLLALTVIGHGDLIKLVEPRLTQVFKEKSKDGDTLKTLLNSRKVKVTKVASTSVQHNQLAMVDQHIWAFTKARAEVNGLLIVPSPKGLTIDSPDNIKGTVHEIKIDDLLDAQLNVDTTSALNKIKVTAWNIKTQKDHPVAVGSAAKITGGNQTASSAAKAVEHPDWQTQSFSPLESGELKGWSAGEVLYRELDRYQGYLTLTGTGQFALGDKIKLLHFGSVFKGEYFISGLSHQIDQNGWRTTVHFGLPITRTGFFKKPSHSNQGVPGLLVGQVMPFKKDPDGLSRLQVKIPAFGTKNNIVWARLASPYASKDVGLFLPPNPNDEVILGWFGGEASDPVILGAMYNPKNKPPIALSEKNEKRGLIMVKDKLSWLFDEKEKTLTQVASDKVSVVLSEKEGVTINQDKNKLSVNKGMLVDSDKDITLKAKGKSIIKPGGDASIEAGGKCLIKASKTEVK
ncbi:phage baseplate assembly protein V [Spartinivicinus poritis]|uniref:Phage baseplate assembly protein V n=1 Tax=Spartinivicinus poritis TaxID=2994640 RepID=A0ABT5U6Z2_9GAMM|nr:phage baseplate assembly protein V [Spartinivicinus sp. A2-2]MDE1462129.1 phage baseplate assembly protein V [Spartinivicinus sp. A2-2]